MALGDLVLLQMAFGGIRPKVRECSRGAARQDHLILRAELEIEFTTIGALTTLLICIFA